MGVLITPELPPQNCCITPTKRRDYPLETPKLPSDYALEIYPGRLTGPATGG